MRDSILLILITASLTGCLTNPDVTLHTERIGATHHRKDSGYSGNTEYSFVEQGIRITNASENPIYYSGYSPASPLIGLETRSKITGRWIQESRGYCGVGIKEQSLKPGDSISLTIALPIEYADRDFRIGLQFRTSKILRPYHEYHSPAMRFDAAKLEPTD